MGTPTGSGSKEPKWKGALDRLVKSILEWEDEQHKKQRARTKNERDNS